MKEFEIMVLLSDTILKAVGDKKEITNIFNHFRQDKETPIRTRILEDNEVLKEKTFGEETYWSEIEEEWEYSQELRNCNVYKVDLRTHHEECVQCCKNRNEAINEITFLIHGDSDFGKEYIYTIG